jgi:hypothetical protein
LSLEAIVIPSSEKLSFAQIVQKEMAILISGFKAQQLIASCSVLDCTQACQKSCQKVVKKVVIKLSKMSNFA